MSPHTTYLITGANRGLGQALLATYLARPNTTVIAAVRDPSHESAKALSNLPKGEFSKLIVVKIDSASEPDALAAVKTLQAEHNITVLDVVIANAGISKIYPIVAEVKAEDLREHFNVNVVGVVLLFQAVLPLLQKSIQPKFVALSSSAGSIGNIEYRNVPNAAYGTSKATLNYVIRKAHFENENLIVFPVDPGWVQTEMGNRAAVMYGFGDKAEISVKQSIDGVSAVIDSATREKTSGHFMVYDGTESLW